MSRIYTFFDNLIHRPIRTELKEFFWVNEFYLLTGLKSCDSHSFPKCINAIQQTFTGKADAVERFVQLRTLDAFVCRLSAGKVDQFPEKSGAFIFVEYHHPDMQPLELSIPAEYYFSGNEIFSAAFVLWHLQKQSRPFVFDEFYTLLVVYETMENFTLQSYEYVRLYPGGYTICVNKAMMAQYVQTSLREEETEWSPWKNGYYIHLIHLGLYCYFKNFTLASFLAMKMYSVNYFYWFGTSLSIFENARYNWLKQFVRLTDTGHLASLLMMYDSRFIGLAHNIHFIILFGYYAGRFCFDLKDADKIVHRELDSAHLDLLTVVHHTLPYCLVLANMDSCDSFGFLNSVHTMYWMYLWFGCIYIPWRVWTGDVVYSVLDMEQTPALNVFYFVAVIHLLVGASNSIGYGICHKLI